MQRLMVAGLWIVNWENVKQREYIIEVLMGQLSGGTDETHPKKKKAAFNI
jgi:hypothetical protein